MKEERDGDRSAESSLTKKALDAGADGDMRDSSRRGGIAWTQRSRVQGGATLIGAMLASYLLAPPGRPTHVAPTRPIADLSPAGLVRKEREMIFISRQACDVGSSDEERLRWAKQFGCDPTWLNDDMEKHAVELPAFWIDRSPVTNAEYLAFVEATGARPPWPGGGFPRERANHPVVGVNCREARAYAQWTGKRLPSAEEWEVAAQSAQPGPYPWGSQWSGPVKPPDRNFRPRWDLPGTRPVGSGQCGRSKAGMEDLAGQVCEWTATTTMHHGGPFYLLKGASWLHEDPVNYRTAASFWAREGMHTPLIGFRCALDGGRTPPAVPRKISADAPNNVDFSSPYDEFHHGEPQIYHVSESPEALNRHLLHWSRQFIEGNGPIEHSRGFLIHVPSIGPWPLCLFFAEALVWGDQQLLAGYGPSQPPLRRRPSARGGTAYAIDFDEMSVQIKFETGREFFDLVSTITNKTDTPSKYLSGSCFSLTSHPYFYDCEMLRTYQLTGSGEFVPLRQLPRRGPCVRWIAGSDLTGYGGEPSRGVMAVLSRDRRWTFASVRIEASDDFNVIGNPWLSCLHTDARVLVGPRSKRVTRQRLYFIQGGLKELKRRLEQDVKQGDFKASTEVSSCR
jgi:formylglycine-generating enzyme required for sulfatase activity